MEDEDISYTPGAQPFEC